MKNLFILLFLFLLTSCSEEKVRKPSYEIIEIENGYVGEIYKDGKWHFVYLDSNCYYLSVSEYTFESDSNYLKERIVHIMKEENVSDYFFDEVY